MSVGAESVCVTRPILFSGPVIRAIIAGYKTQTRRVVNPQPQHLQVHQHGGKTLYDGEHRMWCWKDVVVENIWDFPQGEDRKTLAAKCPYGVPGDRLWVRETWAGDYHGLTSWADRTYYRADLPADPNEAMTANHAFGLMRWKPSIHMPRKRSRLTLEVVSVRAERLQEISEADAIEEGITKDEAREYVYTGHSPSDEAYVAAYADLWNRINGKREGCAWVDSPWVWVVEFRKA